MFHLGPKLDEIPVLILQDFRSAHRAMPRADRLGSQFHGRFQGLDPLSDIAVASEVVRAIHAGITREENFFLGQPGKSVAARVRHAEVQ